MHNIKIHFKIIKPLNTALDSSSREKPQGSGANNATEDFGIIVYPYLFILLVIAKQVMQQKLP